jgi:hypothetical protein
MITTPPKTFLSAKEPLSPKPAASSLADGI